MSASIDTDTKLSITANLSIMIYPELVNSPTRPWGTPPPNYNGSYYWKYYKTNRKLALLQQKFKKRNKDINILMNTLTNRAKSIEWYTNELEKKIASEHYTPNTKSSNSELDDTPKKIKSPKWKRVF